VRGILHIQAATALGCPENQARYHNAVDNSPNGELSCEVLIGSRVMYRVTSCPEGLTGYYTHKPEGECG
jgi:hypothetical protein